MSLCAGIPFSIPQPLCGDSVPPNEVKIDHFSLFLVSLLYMLLSDTCKLRLQMKLSAIYMACSL